MATRMISATLTPTMLVKWSWTILTVLLMLLSSAVLTVMSGKRNNILTETHKKFFFCRTAPTKQNLLCNSQSPLEVVSSVSKHSLSGPREIRYVSHVSTRYILLLDRSQRMKERWSNLHNALFG